MTESAPNVYNYASDVGNAVRRAGDASPSPEQADALHLVASYLETEFDRAAGRVQTVIGNLEIKIGERVKETHDMVRSLGEFLQQMQAEQRQQYEQLRAGQAGLQVEISQQLAALGERIAEVAERQARAEHRIEEHDRLITSLATRVARLELMAHVGEA